MWAFICPHNEGRSPTHGYEATREAAMAVFAKSWQRGGSTQKEFSFPFMHHEGSIALGGVESISGLCRGKARCGK